MHRALHLLVAGPILLAGCAPQASIAPATRPPAVSTATDRLALEAPSLLGGKRVGLITNQTGVDREQRSTIDVLAAIPSLKLVALFSPEHGIRGTAAPGEKVDSGMDERTGLPIHSLYGETRKPTPEMLSGVDALVFDIQDIGSRTYTYIYTMALAMQAAAEQKIPFVVLDRPNPINGVAVEGNLLDPAFSTFVGMYPIPVRHGMTAGELARLFNREFGIGAELSVVPVEGWRREMWGEQTGQPWVDPSPSIRRVETAIHYPGTVFFEGTNLSAGRGSEVPFEQIGAPWLRSSEVIGRVNTLGLPGVRFDAVEFTPHAPGDGKFAEQPLHGIRLVITDRESYRPIATSLLLIDAIRTLHPREFAWDVSHFDRLAGTDRMRRAIEAGELPAMLRQWDAEAERFRSMREPYLLYR